MDIDQINTAAPKTLEEATERLAELIELVRELAAQNETLREELERLSERSGSNSRNSSRPPSTDSEAVRAKRKSRKRSNKPKGAQPGHIKHDRALVDEAQLSDKPKCYFPQSVCGCGSAVDIETTPACRHQVFDVPPIKPIIHEHQSFAGVCSGCGKRHVASLPSEVPSGQMGPGLLALIAHLSGEFHLSIRKIQRFLAEHYQLHFSIGAISQAQGKMNPIMAEPYRDIGHYLRQQPIAHADETRHFRGKECFWLWILANPFAVYFMVHYSRGKGAANALLGHFGGVLVTDDFGGYNDVPRSRRQLCFAHLLRHFILIGTRRGNAGDIGRRLEFITYLIFRIRHRLDAGLISKVIYVRRMERLRKSFTAQLERGTRLRLDGRTRRKCKHLLGREEMCWTHIAYPQVPLTNNLAERELRQYVIWRKLSYAVHSHRGNLFRPMVLSLVQTARLLGVSSYEFLKEIALEYQQTGEVTKRLPLSESALLPAP